MAERAGKGRTPGELREAPPVVHEAESQLLYDLAIVVGAVYQQIIEPTQAGKVPKRIATKIFPLLHGSRPDYYEDADYYLDMVFVAAQALELIQLYSSVGQKTRYVPGPGLAKWAALRPSEQTRLLLQLWRDPAVRFWNDLPGANYQPPFYGFSYYIDIKAARAGLLDYLIKQCEPGQWYALEPFLQDIKLRRPLLLREQSRYPAYNNARNRNEVLASWDSTDGEMITGILASSLHEFGLITTGYQTANAGQDEWEQRNPTAFQFTELAAEVLWKQQPETLPAAARPLIVQPNFELILLQPDYRTLYTLLPFARVNQVEMVSQLSLTQESVRHGVEAGMSIESIIQTLKDLSQKDLPQNVLYSLQDWGRLYKSATISQIVLLEVESEGAADEICASSKLRALELRRLGPRAIAVGNQVSLQVLRSSLEKEGVILHIQGDILRVRDVTSSSTYYGKRR